MQVQKQILSKILEILNESYSDKNVELLADSQILTDGIIDSLQLMLFSEELESTFEIEFAAGEINHSHFTSPLSICTLIESKIGG